MKQADAITFFTFDRPPTPTPSRSVVHLVVRAFRLPPWNENLTIPKARYILKEEYAKLYFQAVFVYRYCALVGVALAAKKIISGIKPHFWINTLCVDPAFQGRGIGGALTRKIVEVARAQSVESVRLSTMAGSPAAALYEKVGFEPISLPRMGTRQQVMRLRL